VLVPLKARDGQIAALNQEIEDATARVLRITKRRPDLEKWRKISLPPDPADPAKPGAAAAAPKLGAAPEPAHADLARREYEEELSKLFRASGFDAGSITIVPKQPDAKSGPTLANKKPIYTRLEFAVQLKGDMLSLVDCMERFYKLRLLHQIRNLSIVRPPDSAAARSGGAAATDLDITMTVEALVLDTAEVRKTLLPEKPVDLPPLLAAGREYKSIAGKNVFFGPPPRQVERTVKVDAAPFIKLDGITATADGPTASLWDMLHNHDYQIRPKSIGGYRVEVSYYIQNRKRSLRPSAPQLELLADDGETVEQSWQIVRIDINSREVILRDKDKYYALHIGQTLADMKALSKEQLTALGIKDERAAATPAPADDLEKE
jgi:hypothetical protein